MRHTISGGFQPTKEEIHLCISTHGIRSRKPIYIETDTLDYALGACISQKNNQGWLYSVAFLSRKFTSAELNYQIHDKELMAIVAICQEWRHYIEGSIFLITIYTDHKNLIYFTTTKELNRRQVR